MDWFTWLSKTGLESKLIYEYGLAFSNNELEQEDITYFNHEFLQSMGISIAKHRLEILKLARKERPRSHLLQYPMTRVLVAIKRTKSSVSKYIRALVHRQDSSSSALVVVPRTSNGYVGSASRSWYRGAMLKRNKKSMFGVGANSNKQGRLLLTNGTCSPNMVVSYPRLDSFSSPLVYGVHCEEEKAINGGCDGDYGVDYDDHDVDDYDHGYYPNTTKFEEVRWDTMFQNLKPT